MIVEKGRYNKRIREDGAVIYVLFPKAPDVEGPVNIIDELPDNENAEWPFLEWNRPLTNIKYITIHHSAGSYSIDYWHSLHTGIRRSWSRVGYHFGAATFSKYPNEVDLYQMNKLATVSWHDTRNYDTVGFCFGGDLRAGEPYQGAPTDKQLECWGRFTAWIMPQLPNLYAIVGHSRWSATECQGDLPGYAPMLIDASLQFGQDISQILSTKRISAVSRAYNFVTRKPRLDAHCG
jgi:hypothetical protein